MRLSSFLQYARAELVNVPHPYAAEIAERLEDVPLLVRVVDHVLARATGRYDALAENFYSALHTYLTAPRHRKALVRASVEKLSIAFEGFLRTVVTVFPDLDQELFDRDGEPRGRLSNQGYLTHFASLLLGVERRLNSGETGWRDEPATSAVLRVCHTHQQRAKHEAREYSLTELEELARSILAAYLVVARFLVNNTSVVAEVRSRLDAASSQAVCHWPAILEVRLDELHLGGEDSDLAEQCDSLRDRSAALHAKATAILEAGVPEESGDLESLRVACEALEFDYEMLITEANMRDWGRDAEADLYL